MFFHTKQVITKLDPLPLPSKKNWPTKIFNESLRPRSPKEKEKKMVDQRFCLKVRFRRPGRKFVSWSRDAGAVSFRILETPWKICLDLPPKTRTSPDSKLILFAFSTSTWSPYRNSAVSPIEKDTMGIPLPRLSRPSSLSWNKQTNVSIEAMRYWSSNLFDSSTTLVL